MNCFRNETKKVVFKINISVKGWFNRLSVLQNRVIHSVLVIFPSEDVCLLLFLLIFLFLYFCHHLSALRVLQLLYSGSSHDIIMFLVLLVLSYWMSNLVLPENVLWVPCTDVNEKSLKCVERKTNDRP